METSKILSANFLDLLFDGRNKAYGAYDLRTTYNNRMWKALGITTIIFFTVAGIVYFKNSIAQEEKSLPSWRKQLLK